MEVDGGVRLGAVCGNWGAEGGERGWIRDGKIMQDLEIKFARPPAPVAAPPPSSAFDSWASSRTADFEESNQPPRSPGRETGWLRDMNSTLGASTVGRGDFSAVRV